MTDGSSVLSPPVAPDPRRTLRLLWLVVVRTTLVALIFFVGWLTWYCRSELLVWFASTGRMTLVRCFLLPAQDVNRRSVSGYTPLMAASWNGHRDIVDLLVRRGAKIEGVDNDGNTALIWAAFMGRSDIVSDFINKGAVLNHQNALGNTAIMCAMMNGYPGVARTLLNAGADINLENKAGETVLVKAGQRGYGDMVELFKRHGARKTFVFIGPDPFATKPLSASHRWALATAALLDQYNGDSHELLGSRPASDTAWARNMLRDGWEIENRRAAINMLDWLQETGRREDYQAADGRPRQKRSSQIRYLAWDYCRLVWVAGVSHIAGYITEDEAWERVMKAARAIQSNYSSWREMGEDYLQGRERWNHGRDPRFDYVLNLLSDPLQPNSPWNKNRWDTDLSR